MLTTRLPGKMHTECACVKWSSDIFSSTNEMEARNLNILYFKIRAYYMIGEGKLVLIRMRVITCN